MNLHGAVHEKVIHLIVRPLFFRKTTVPGLAAGDSVCAKDLSGSTAAEIDVTLSLSCLGFLNISIPRITSHGDAQRATFPIGKRGNEGSCPRAGTADIATAEVVGCLRQEMLDPSAVPSVGNADARSKRYRHASSLAPAVTCRAKATTGREDRMAASPGVSSSQDAGQTSTLNQIDSDSASTRGDDKESRQTWHGETSFVLHSTGGRRPNTKFAATDGAGGSTSSVNATGRLDFGCISGKDSWISNFGPRDSSMKAESAPPPTTTAKVRSVFDPSSTSGCVNTDARDVAECDDTVPDETSEGVFFSSCSVGRSGPDRDQIVSVAGSCRASSAVDPYDQSTALLGSLEAETSSIEPTALRATTLDGGSTLGSPQLRIRRAAHGSDRYPSQVSLAATEPLPLTKVPSTATAAVGVTAVAAAVASTTGMPPGSVRQSRRDEQEKTGELFVEPEPYKIRKDERAMLEWTLLAGDESKCSRDALKTPRVSGNRNTLVCYTRSLRTVKAVNDSDVCSAENPQRVPARGTAGKSRVNQDKVGTRVPGAPLAVRHTATSQVMCM